MTVQKRRLHLAGMILISLFVFYTQSGISHAHPWHNDEHELVSPLWQEDTIEQEDRENRSAQFGFVQSVLSADFSSAAFLLVLLVTFFAGATHAFTPGHGKAIMAAYLVSSSRHRYRDVLTLALAMTLTHTFVIYALGVMFLVFESIADITSLVSYIEVAGAILAAVLSIILIRRGILRLRKASALKGHTHHLNNERSDSTRRFQTLFAGFSGGLTPCFDAFALFLLAVAAGQTLTGLLLVAVFSVGLALSVMLLGVALIKGKGGLTRFSKFEKVSYAYAPIMSGLFLLVFSGIALVSVYS